MKEAGRIRVLVVGNGAREHALAWRLKSSPKVEELYAAPGNAGLAEIATCVPIESSSIIELADFAEELKVGLTIVGPELPLMLGIVDEFHKRGLTILGPTQAAAELEGSKVFAKRFMVQHGIPTAGFVVCSSPEEAAEALDARKDYPVVVKADGLAGGKGVVVAASRAEADAAVQSILVDRQFGKAGEQIILEDCLVGTELSFQVLTDGRHALPLAVARDYKRALDGDLGANTGGMGAISPSRAFSQDLGRQITQDIVTPTLRGMEKDGRPVQGIVYVGIMLTSDGPKVLEYNVRFGDPETQSIIPRLATDPVDLFLAAVNGSLEGQRVEWKKEVSVAVVLASEGYPGSIRPGVPITGLDILAKLPVNVFHAGTRAVGGEVVTTAGRVLTVNACEKSRQVAVETVYKAIDKIRFEGMQYRRDIGLRDEKPAV